MTNAIPTIDTTHQPTAGRKVWIAMRVLTVLVALIWIGFSGEWFTRSAEVVGTMKRIGLPLYMTVVIGLTHLLGGIGLLIPNRPKLTQWVFAGLTYDLILATISHLASHDPFTDALHPIVLIIILGVLFALRSRTGDNIWSSR